MGSRPTGRSMCRTLNRRLHREKSRSNGALAYILLCFFSHISALRPRQDSKRNARSSDVLYAASAEQLIQVHLIRCATHAGHLGALPPRRAARVSAGTLRKKRLLASGGALVWVAGFRDSRSHSRPSLLVRSGNKAAGSGRPYAFNCAQPV